MKELFFSPHMDDESLAMFHSILNSDAKLFFVTNGAPFYSDEHYFLKKGLSRIDYILKRKSESLLALDLLGVSNSDVSFLDFDDLETNNNIFKIKSSFRKILSSESFSKVHCLAAEGNHPDHDIICFILASLQNEFDFILIEHSINLLKVDPHYFVPDSSSFSSVILSEKDLSFKLRILDLYSSQNLNLSFYDFSKEYFREVIPSNFSFLNTSLNLRFELVSSLFLKSSRSKLIFNLNLLFSSSN